MRHLIPIAYPEYDPIDAAVGNSPLHQIRRISVRPPFEIRVPWTRNGYARYQAVPLVDWDQGRVRYVIPRMHDGVIQVGWADWTGAVGEQTLEIWLGRPPETGTVHDRLRASCHMPEVNQQIVIGHSTPTTDRVAAGSGWLQVDKWDARVQGDSRYARATPKTASLVESAVRSLVRWHFLSWGGRSDLFRAFDRHRAIQRLADADAEQLKLSRQIAQLQVSLNRMQRQRPGLVESASRHPVQPWDQVVIG